ncbi:MAG: glycoside hydrolase family 3 C-terminal domain-containing protein [Pseudomonadota bacterium]
MSNTDFAPRKGMSDGDIADTITEILANATLAEKVAMMSGRGFYKAYVEDGRVWAARPYRAGGGCERLNVPALWFTDGPRGVARGNSTAFPCTMARGASFDTDLEYRIGIAMGAEVRAQGCNLSGAVCVNLLRHPGWGRAQETYGEDPHHLGAMGAALATGIQHHNVIATVKHFAANSIENARFKVNVEMDARTLREVYLPHFKMILDAGCASVMSAYNKVNGPYCGHSHELLTDILRGDWGFNGFVHSDWMLGVYGPDGAAAGLDVENPEPVQYGEKLVAEVEGGRIDTAVIDRACMRILTTLYSFASAQDPLPDYPLSLVASEDHRALAREAAQKSAVLLKNEALLPLVEGASVAMFGRLADLENTGDNGSSKVRAPYIVTPYGGLRAALGQRVTLAGDERNLEAAVTAARGADIAIVVTGYTAEEEGEYIPGEMAAGLSGQDAQGRVRAIGGDRDNLGLPDDQVALIQAVSAVNPRTLVVIVAGSAVLVEEWVEGVAGIIQTFYAGMEGGAALADLLTGAVNPSGKLPFTVARDAGDYPFFDKNADAITYGPLHGYTLLEEDGVVPRFPFGFGLSYTRFAYSEIMARVIGGQVEASITITNTGAVAGREVVQLYVGFPGGIKRPHKLLRGFASVPLAPAEARQIDFAVPISELGWWDEAAHVWQTEHGVHCVYIGGDSASAEAVMARVTLD